MHPPKCFDRQLSGLSWEPQRAQNSQPIGGRGVRPSPGRRCSAPSAQEGAKPASMSASSFGRLSATQWPAAIS